MSGLFFVSVTCAHKRRRISVQTILSIVPYIILVFRTTTLFSRVLSPSFLL